MADIDVCRLILHVQRDGYVRLDARPSIDVSSRVEMIAIRSWLRGWPEHSLNECDHMPFTCETFNAVSRQYPCAACSVRKRLNLPPLKEKLRPATPEGHPKDGK